MLKPSMLAIALKMCNFRLVPVLALPQNSKCSVVSVAAAIILLLSSALLLTMPIGIYCTHHLCIHSCIAPVSGQVGTLLTIESQVVVPILLDFSEELVYELRVVSASEHEVSSVQRQMFMGLVDFLEVLSFFLASAKVTDMTKMIL